MAKVIVIGGGAAGLISAISSAKAGNDVILLERNNNCGKKLLITGNGRCNYFNADLDAYHFHTSSNKNLNEVITKENISEISNFFESIGVIPKIKQSYYYPLSNQSSSVCNALLKEADLLNVNIKNNVLVSDIIKNEEKFQITTNNGVFLCDKVIITTGSKAAPKTGSDGLGYDILKNLGHNIVPVLPALVQLICNDKITKDWDGVRNESIVSIYINDKKIKEEYGELMLTDYGLSGICIFNLSGEAAKNLRLNKKVSIKINFLPSLNLKNINETIKWLDEYDNKVPNRTISELLDGLLNYKLVNAILKNIKIKGESNWQNLTRKEKESLVNALISFEIDVIGTNSFDKAQVCSGGIPLEEINLKTMESVLVPNLFIAGEILDVDGDCGGYNLAWAWISGMIAGKGTGRND